MQRSFLILLIVIFSSGLFAQEQKHIVFLKNKDNNPYSLSNPLAFLTQRSLDRRTKNNIQLDQKDIPVTPSYISQIAATGATVVYPLKWFNAVCVNTNVASVIQAIAALPFVDHIDQVLTDRPFKSEEKQGIREAGAIPPYTMQIPMVTSQVKSTGSLNYGQSYNQVHMIAVDGLHDMGYMGEGKMIAILDAGFYHVDQIPAFDSLRAANLILGTRDFNIPGNNVYGDNMHTHGTSVLSTMGANLPGQMIGTAPHASFWLIRTEVAEYEAIVEEYNWCAGAEFADSLGADVINSSLGYTTFDNPVFNHSYADMNGNTTPITRAGDLACSRGILVVNSAGNEGGSAWQYIGAPADGDSVFTLGAVNSAGIYAPFSSTGPTSDGRTKPDVTAQGQGTTVISGQGFVSQGSGTSFSSPVTAGAIACLMQSTPAFTAQEIRNAVRNTSSKANQPDDLYGWGIPNMVNARLFLNTVEQTSASRNGYILTPNPFTGAPALQSVSGRNTDAKVQIFTVSGQMIFSSEINFPSTEPVLLNALNGQPAGLYFIRISTPDGQVVLRGMKI